MSSGSTRMDSSSRTSDHARSHRDAGPDRVFGERGCAYAEVSRLLAARLYDEHMRGPDNSHFCFARRSRTDSAR